MPRSELGAYLNARRAALTPDEVNLPVQSLSPRRVPGLRREEVALLAGVSVDYYVRLEQGRERTPSPQVVEALAAALRLDEDGRQHLYRLAGLGPRARAALPTAGRVDPSLLALMDAWPHNPAVVHNRAYDVLASNAIADALFDDWTHSRNHMYRIFTNPEAQSFYPDWDEVARGAVAGFRLGHGMAPDDPRVRRVLDELLAESPVFAELWTRHEAQGKTLSRKRINHRDVGLLTLTMQTFEVRAAPGQELVIYHAAPGSRSAEALALLGSLAATSRREARP
ncbi:helix-turn-helix transcriptional regulator [Streptomyces sp. 4N509B]|uniref:helix-turn-helix transcriptional regulator n=1 Tax=Streptomyces sp. 4N509B TaxID=3457413 RepID=UPI003FD54404